MAKGSWDRREYEILEGAYSDADTALRTLLVGTSGNTPVVTDHQALQVTFPPEGKSAFGELSVAKLTPVLQASFPYSVNPSIVSKRENQSGTVTHANRMGVLSTGAAANSSAEIRSKDLMKYNPGQGAAVRFTAVFSTGVANSTQMIGIGNESDGLFFGYNGTSFGVLHRRNGAPEIRTLTISTKSSTVESVTVTLNGDAESVPVTNGANATVTANEIAAFDYSDTGRGWDAYAVGNTVVFKSWDASPRTGAYSISGTTVVGSFAQTVVGVSPTDTWIPQASWNGADKFDGTGLSGVTLDPTKGNVYQIKYQWLGYGLLSFYIEDPDDGEFHLVHAIEYANANTSPSLGDPSLRLVAKAENTSNTSNIQLKTGSMGSFLEGEDVDIGIRVGLSSSKSSVTTSLLPILSIRQGLSDNSFAVQTFARILRLAFAVEHTKPMYFSVFKNPTLVGASWVTANSNTSIFYDTTATSVTGGVNLITIPLGKSSNTFLDLIEDKFAYHIHPGDIITIAAATTSGTGGEASVGVSMIERV